VSGKRERQHLRLRDAGGNIGRSGGAMARRQVRGTAAGLTIHSAAPFKILRHIDELDRHDDAFGAALFIHQAGAAGRDERGNATFGKKASM